MSSLVPLQPPDSDPVLTALEAAVSLRRAQLETETRVGELERKVSALGDLDDGYTTVVGFFNLHGGTVTETDASIIGKMATRICNDEGIPVRKVKSTRWGKVNCYPESVILAAYDWFKKGA
jgi:hypothetical protein